MAKKEKAPPMAIDGEAKQAALQELLIADFSECDYWLELSYSD